MGDQQCQDKEEEIREVFNFIDANHNGTISLGELKRAVQLLKQNPTDSDIKEIMESCSKDGNNTMSYEEFVELWHTNLSLKNPEQDLADACAEIDKDGNGYLDRNDLKTFICRDDDDVDQEELNEFFDALDTNNDGRVDIGEFIKFIQNPTL